MVERKESEHDEDIGVGEVKRVEDDCVHDGRGRSRLDVASKESRSVRTVGSQ